MVRTVRGSVRFVDDVKARDECARCGDGDSGGRRQAAADSSGRRRRTAESRCASAWRLLLLVTVRLLNQCRSVNYDGGGFDELLLMGCAAYAMLTFATSRRSASVRMRAAARLATVLWLLLCLLLLSPLQCSAHPYAVGMPIPMLKRSQYKGVSNTSTLTVTVAAFAGCLATCSGCWDGAACLLAGLRAFLAAAC